MDNAIDVPPINLRRAVALLHRLAAKKKLHLRGQQEKLSAHIFSAVSMASEACGSASVPFDVAAALAEVLRLMTTKNKRTAQKLMRRSKDPELMCYLDWPDAQFKSKFRVTKKLFFYLLDGSDLTGPGIRSLLESTDEAKKHIYNKALLIKPERKLLIALWYFAHGGDWSSVAAAGSVGNSTARKYVIQVDTHSQIPSPNSFACACRCAKRSSLSSKSDTCT